MSQGENILQGELIDSDTLEIDPQKNLIPATDSELERIISAEANYNRWSNFLFPHGKSDDLFERRKYEWEITLPDSEVAQASIEVIPSKEMKGYSSRSYDVFLAITNIWQKLGMPDEVMTISLSDIARQLDLEPNGRTLNIILSELDTLYYTTVSWNFSFEKTNMKSETVRNKRVLDHHDYQKIKERKKGIGSKTSMCELRLSEHIRDNLRNRVSSPINFKARKSIKSEVAKTIYSRVDNILATHKRYERTAVNIVSEYNLTKSRHQYKSQRKALLERIVKNLDGVETSRKGVFLHVWMDETADAKDYKLIFMTKGEQKKLAKPRLPVENKDKDMVEFLVQHIADVVGGLEENRGLYTTFARHYTQNHIDRALGDFKELTANSIIENKQSYFTTLMHTVAHKLERDWIKPCDKNCQFREENQLKF